MSIADSLRQQAQGLGQAIQNANDAIGVAQTADGALDEYTKIIDTIRSKAIQASSDGQTLSSRQKIQADIDRLMEEAQNIASSTSFNGQTLLNGAFKNKSFHIGAYSGESVRISINDVQTEQIGRFAMTSSTSTSTASDTVGFRSTTASADAGTMSLKATINGVTVDSGTVNLTSGAHESYAIAQKLADAFNAQAQIAGADIHASIYETSSSTGNAPSFAIRLSGSDSISNISITDNVNDGVDAKIQSSASVGLNNNFSKIDVTSKDGAERAILTLDHSLKDIDSIRSDIGSVQNQLESTIRNISVTQVNVQAAESQIRDVDFAAESANFAKQNILAQTGMFSLSQANTIQQNVLRLLQ